MRRQRVNTPFSEQADPPLPRWLANAREHAWLAALSREMPPGWVCSLVRLHGPQALDTTWRLAGMSGIAPLCLKLPQASRAHPLSRALTENYVTPHQKV